MSVSNPVTEQDFLSARRLEKWQEASAHLDDLYAPPKTLNRPELAVTTTQKLAGPGVHLGNNAYTAGSAIRPSKSLIRSPAVESHHIKKNHIVSHKEIRDNFEELYNPYQENSRKSNFERAVEFEASRKALVTIPAAGVRLDTGSLATKARKNSLPVDDPPAGDAGVLGGAGLHYPAELHRSFVGGEVNSGLNYLCPLDPSVATKQALAQGIAIPV